MKLKLNVPQSLADITLAEYKQYDTIVNTNAENENSERFVNLKMLEIFCGITFEQARAIQLNDYNELLVHLYEVLQEQPKLVQRFKMGEVEFGFVPNLEEMTFGEYIDLDTYIHDMQQMEKAMAVLYRPIKTSHKDKYTIHEYQGDLLHNEMLNMPMSAVVSSIVFFLSFRDRIVERYDELFGGAGSTTSAAGGFAKKWGWYQSFYALALGRY